MKKRKEENKKGKEEKEREKREKKIKESCAHKRTCVRVQSGPGSLTNNPVGEEAQLLLGSGYRSLDPRSQGRVLNQQDRGQLHLSGQRALIDQDNRYMY